MDRVQRARLEVLERVVAEVDAREVRGLADLRRSGWAFSSFDQARRWLGAERSRRRRIAELMFEPTVEQWEIALAVADAEDALRGGKAG